MMWSDESVGEILDENEQLKKEIKKLKKIIYEYYFNPFDDSDVIEIIGEMNQHFE